MIWIPRIAMVVLLLLGLGIAIGQHGQPKKESVNSCWPTWWATVIRLALLWWGGFFDAVQP